MAIWLYCQSCKQWSKSASSLSDDKSCPMCSNLYINSKPIINSSPYSVIVEQAQEQPKDYQTSSSIEAEPALDAHETLEPAEKDLSSGSPETADSLEIEEVTESEALGLEETAEALEMAASHESNSANEHIKTGRKKETTEMPESVNRTKKHEKSETSETHVIQVVGKMEETEVYSELGESDGKFESIDTSDSAQQWRRRIRPR